MGEPLTSAPTPLQRPRRNLRSSVSSLLHSYVFCAFTMSLVSSSHSFPAFLSRGTALMLRGAGFGVG